MPTPNFDLDLPSLLADMLNAAQSVLKKKWPAARDFATNEFSKLLREAAHIAQMQKDKVINATQAALLMDMQRNACRSVLLAVEGIGIIAAEAAINAALSVVRTAVNTALGFVLF